MFFIFSSYLGDVRVTPDPLPIRIFSQPIGIQGAFYDRTIQPFGFLSRATIIPTFGFNRLHRGLGGFFHLIPPRGLNEYLGDRGRPSV